MKASGLNLDYPLFFKEWLADEITTLSSSTYCDNTVHNDTYVCTYVYVYVSHNTVKGCGLQVLD